MNRKKVTLTFDENDNPTISVEGCTGSECQALTKEIEEALGSKVKDEKTREFYQHAKTKINNRA